MLGALLLTPSLGSASLDPVVPSITAGPGWRFTRHCAASIRAAPNRGSDVEVGSTSTEGMANLPIPAHRNAAIQFIAMHDPIFVGAHINPIEQPLQRRAERRQLLFFGQPSLALAMSRYLSMRGPRFRFTPEKRRSLLHLESVDGQLGIARGRTRFNWWRRNFVRRCSTGIANRNYLR